MKKILVTCFLLWGCLSLTAQNKVEQAKAVIAKIMPEFIDNLNYINADSDEQMEPEDIQATYGGDYLNINKSKYNNLTHWIQSYYKYQMGRRLLNHRIEVNKTSIEKVNNDKADLRYKFNATLRRESADTSQDFMLRDEEVSFVVIADKAVGITILEIGGNWNVNTIRPHYEWEYTLSVSDEDVYFSEYGGEETIKIESHAQQLKKYGGLKTLKVGEPKKVEFKVKSDSYLKPVTSGNNIAVSTRRNYGEMTRQYTLNVTQVPLDNKVYAHTVVTNGPQTRIISIRQGAKSRAGFFDFDGMDAPSMDVKFHYGLNTTFGLSASWLLEDYRFTLGLYAAMCENRLSQVDLGGLKISSSLELEATYEEDGYQVHYKSVNPDERGYSSLVDPDGEAKHKKVYSYIMAMPGIYVNNWLHFDLGVGVARTQNTYEMAKVYRLATYEYTPLSDGLPTKETQYVPERTENSFLYRDYEKYRFAFRPGINFLIPLDKHDGKYLTLGGGYTFVVGDRDAHNIDFSIGYGFQF